jgi:steroid 5-alpha reductase family enzyme
MGRRVQLLFQACALAMLGLLVVRVRAGEWSTLNWLMLAVAAACCLLVFVRFLYVFNYSYALAAVLNGSLLVLALPSPASVLVGGAAVLYGVRLFWFSWTRQHHPSYASRMARVVAADAAMPKPAKLALWLNCSLLLSFHLLAVYCVAREAVVSAGLVTGAATMLAGIVLEGVADWQKQQVKQAAPGVPVLHGAFRYVRHPNYTGEILVQAGLVVAGWSAVSGLAEALAVAIAPGYIIMLMLTEARRLDRVQETTYWDHAGYRAWRTRTGALLPRLAPVTRGSSPPGAT